MISTPRELVFADRRRRFDFFLLPQAARSMKCHLPIRARARVIIQCEREHSVSCITRVSIKGRYFETTEHLSEYARGCRCKLICGMMAPFRENNLRVASISCVLLSLSSLSLPLSLCFIFSRTLCSFNNELASQKRTIRFPCFRLISLFSPPSYFLSPFPRRRFFE